MLVSGVAAGIAAGVAFGGDWRRLGTFYLQWWPLLVVAAALRLFTFFVPSADVPTNVIGLVGIGVVAARNGRIPGAALIAIGTLANVLGMAVNQGMPYDATALASVGGKAPGDGLHILLSDATRLPFLTDIIPFGLAHGVFSVGDFVIAFGGFLIPFMWLQPEADAKRHDVR